MELRSSCKKKKAFFLCIFVSSVSLYQTDFYRRDSSLDTFDTNIYTLYILYKNNKYIYLLLPKRRTSRIKSF